MVSCRCRQTRSTGMVSGAYLGRKWRTMRAAWRLRQPRTARKSWKRALSQITWMTDEYGGGNVAIGTPGGEKQQHQRPPRGRVAPINLQTGLAFGCGKTKIAIHGLAFWICGSFTPTTLTPSHPFLPDQLDPRFARSYLEWRS